MTAGPYSIGSDLWPGLAKAVEECGELIQAGAKLMAMGGEDALHWDGQGTTVTRLEDEIADVIASVSFLRLHNPVLDGARIAERVAAKTALFRQWHDEHADRSTGYTPDPACRPVCQRERRS
jgi:NTP pyrophosphatase (non-canonical NTP hydrolase)